MTSPYSELKKACKAFPSDPGIYLMKDDKDKIIYIGKAKSLKKRICNYFDLINTDGFRWKHKNIDNDKIIWKNKKLLQKISEIEFIITDNEVEAFLLEANLIKQYRPIFNIELKDQERFTYLKITDETFPRLLVARRNRKSDFTGPEGEIFGPFVYGSSRFISIGTLRKIFKVRICNRLPKKPCLEYFINNCDAPCIQKITMEKYHENINSLKQILKKRDGIQDFLTRMNKDMIEASNRQDYEHAKEIRDTIRTVENLKIKQKIDLIEKKDEEYVGFKVDKLNQTGYVMILKRSCGVISDTKQFEFDILGDNNFSSFLLQYYSSVSNIPETIYVNDIPESRNLLEVTFKKLSGHIVNINKIKRSKQDNGRFDLMKLILKNISIRIEKKYNPVLGNLRDLINLKETPLIIDCFDVSNFGTSFAVGSCVRFVNGTSFKSGYRRFKIQTLKDTQDDVRMINEIVGRRYEKHREKPSEKQYKINDVEEGNNKNVIIQEPNSDELFPIQYTNNKRLIDSLPNLIIIDGGRAQLNSAIKALTEKNLCIHAIALAKQNEEIFLPWERESLKISKKEPVMHLIQSIRDEAHRFGLSYNRMLRKTRLK